MPQIRPITDLRNTTEISELCHARREPVFITKNGYGDLVIMSMEIYESAMRRFSVYKDVEVSERQLESGQIRDARTALAGMRAKYGL